MTACAAATTWPDVVLNLGAFVTVFGFLGFLFWWVTND